MLTPLTTQQSILDEQVVQNNQIVELEEEIESLAPSLDRGKWTLHEAMPLSAGQYAIGVAVDSGYCIDQYERCIQAAPGYPNNIDPIAQSECTRLAAECETAKENGELYIADWAHAAFLHFHKTDSDGKNHTFADYKVGMFIDLFDQGDTGFAVFEIAAAPTLDGDVYTIGVHPVQHEGEAAGLARVKVFELAGADPTDFVRKTGDTMSGALEIKRPTDAEDGSNVAFAVKVGSSGSTTALVVNTNGSVSAGGSSTNAFMASNYEDVITKKYLDTRHGPASMAWKVNKNSTTPPIPKTCSINANTIGAATSIKLNTQPNNRGWAFEQSNSVWYEHKGSTSTNSSMTLTVWRYYALEFQWIGTADVQKIQQSGRTITVTINHCFGNTELSDQSQYYFAVGGLF